MPNQKNDAGSLEDSQSKNLFEIPSEDSIEDNEEVEEVEESGSEEESEEQDLKKSNKKDQGRYEYWQSEATKTKAELEKYQSYAPIVRYLESNPQVLEGLEQYLVTGGKNSASAVQSNPTPAIEEPKAPEIPQVPEGYDPFDNDPKSDSFKYRQAKADYDKQFSEYMLKKNELQLKQVLGPYEQMIQEQKRREAEIAEIKQAQLMLQKTRGWDEKKALDFIMFARNESSYDELPEYYDWKLTKQKERKDQPGQKKEKAPISLGAVGGKGDIPKSGGQRFVDSLRAQNKNLFGTVAK